MILVYWHSDKSVYQRDTAEKIAKIFSELGNTGEEQKQRKWFESFLYIFNLHWDKVDNYRIDKYLMFLRFQFSEVLTYLRDQNY